MAGVATFAGRAWSPAMPGYEQARRGTVANALRPAHRPDLIVRARDEDDVVAAVGLARERGWKVAVSSGGHSWSGSHLRSGGVLIDVSELAGLEVDVPGRAAVVGPGMRSSALAERLAELDLFFPTGHCIGPCLGGFLLQGGFGWHSRTLGPACMSVRAIDVVTAAGELVHADEDSELLWAARGAGPGFFGVVTRFYLQLHQRPAVQMHSTQLYPLDVLDELMRWAHAIADQVPRSIELMVFLRRGLLPDASPALRVLAPALAGSEDEARADLALLETCPVRGHALALDEYVATDVCEMVRGTAEQYPEGHRYAVDNMWTSASVEDLLPGYRQIAATLPDSPSHMMWMNWSPGSPRVPTRPDMAFSLEDSIYIALYGIWKRAGDDQRGSEWATPRMRELEPHASGIQLADEALARRPMPFMADDNLRRLDELRARYDPDSLFHSWVARP